jgi:hypothetical protein
LFLAGSCQRLPTRAVPVDFSAQEQYELLPKILNAVCFEGEGKGRITTQNDSHRFSYTLSQIKKESLSQWSFAFSFPLTPLIVFNIFIPESFSSESLHPSVTLEPNIFLQNKTTFSPHLLSHYQAYLELLSLVLVEFSSRKNPPRLFPSASWIFQADFLHLELQHPQQPSFQLIFEPFFQLNQISIEKMRLVFRDKLTPDMALTLEMIPTRRRCPL